MPVLQVYGSTQPLATRVFWGAEPTLPAPSDFTPCSGTPEGLVAAPGRLRAPRPPALCQRSAMLFTHERGAEASVPAANYPVLIFFGEKETRPFQTWPNLISWGRRGWVREDFPHQPRPREGAGMGRLGHGQEGSVCLSWLLCHP